LAAVAFGVLGILSSAWAADLRGTQGVEEAVPHRYFLHIGPAGVLLDEDADIYVVGNHLDGGTISIKSHLTFAVEAGMFVTPNLAVSFTGGLPPSIKIEADGVMSSMGRVGATTYGPMTLTAHYHFTGLGRLQPYIGAGPTFMYVFDDKDGVMGDLKIDHTVGFAVQVGADYMITDQWGIFFDVKKAYLRTEATGTLGGYAVKADVKLDPLVLHTGVTFRF
jgi:outer membrane protein